MTTTGEAAPEATSAEHGMERHLRRLKSPPRLWFHLVLVPLTLVLLWGTTVPGGNEAGWIALVVLSALGLAWGVRAVLSVTMSGRVSWWLAVAPVCFLLVTALYLADVPLETRWSVSAKDAFATALARGFSNPEIADLLAISKLTVGTHVKNIYRKLEVNSRSEAVFEASSRGIMNAH